MRRAIASGRLIAGTHANNCRAKSVCGAFSGRTERGQSTVDSSSRSAWPYALLRGVSAFVTAERAAPQNRFALVNVHGFTIALVVIIG